jgi:threonine dehydrogenase-like Zn-dependent dehydrogenase
VVVGMPGLTFGIDWAPIFDNEITVTASYTYNHANIWQGQTRSTFAIALEMMEKEGLDLSWMITHRYPLTAFDQALRENFNKRQHPVIKAVFEF